ncbi:MAG: sigma-70 family RNA polymerase sigma factor [Oscillospiraceae bacterium]|nr:sigma-70 family RNA polymerase sigma factor [Oscillospiraceae bacterium]
MTDEELALKIQNGEKSLIAELWKQVERKIRIYVNHELQIDSMHYRAASVGVTKEDLYQEGYFALLRAIKAYNPDKGFRFVSYLKYTVKNSVADAIHIRTPGDRDNPTYRAISIYSPIADDSESQLLDFLQDPKDQFEEIEEAEQRKCIEKDVGDSIADLSPVQRRIILSRYYKLMTLSEIGKSEGISGQRVSQIENLALDQLRKDARIQRHREYTITKLEYRGGIQRWKRTGMSCVEQIVCELSDFEEKQREYHRWTDLRKEAESQ